MILQARYLKLIPKTLVLTLQAAVVQVVSDIDDTLMCSGGNWPAGRDMRYPRKCMYPGALALYSELDIGYCSKLQVKLAGFPNCSIGNLGAASHCRHS